MVKKVYVLSLILVLIILGSIQYFYITNIAPPIDVEIVDEVKTKQSGVYPSIVENDSLLDLDVIEFKKEYAKLPDDYKIKISLNPNIFETIFGIKLKSHTITKKEAEQVTSAYPDDEFLGESPINISLKGLRYFPNIEDLCWYGSILKDIEEVKFLSNLEYIELNKCNLGVSTEGLKGLAEMKKINIYIGHCNIPNIDFLNSFPKRKRNSSVVYLPYNSITEISPLLNMECFKTLDLSGNPIEDIRPLSNIHKVNNLYLDDCNISDIETLSNIKEILHLSISDNRISDLTPLNKLKSLKTLWVKNNKIKDISMLFDFPELTNINVKGNPITNRSQINHFILKKKKGDIKFKY